MANGVVSGNTVTYSVSGDFPNGRVDPNRLTLQIQTSTISVALVSIGVAGDVCSVNFAAPPTPGDVATLNGIVAAHSGNQLTPTVSPDPFVARTIDATPFVAGRMTMPPRCALVSLGLVAAAIRESDGAVATFVITDISARSDGVAVQNVDIGIENTFQSDVGMAPCTVTVSSSGFDVTITVQGLAATGIFWAVTVQQPTTIAL